MIAKGVHIFTTERGELRTAPVAEADTHAALRPHQCWCRMSCPSETALLMYSRLANTHDVAELTFRPVPRTNIQPACFGEEMLEDSCTLLQRVLVLRRGVSMDTAPQN